jgi:hypothetical protein
MKNILKVTLFISFLIPKLGFSMTSEPASLDDCLMRFIMELVDNNFFYNVWGHPSKIRKIYQVSIAASQFQEGFFRKLGLYEVEDLYDNEKGFKIAITLGVHSSKPGSVSFVIDPAKEKYYSTLQIIVDILPPYKLKYRGRKPIVKELTPDELAVKRVLTLVEERSSELREIDLKLKAERSLVTTLEEYGNKIVFLLQKHLQNDVLSEENFDLIESMSLNGE